MRLKRNHIILLSIVAFVVILGVFVSPKQAWVPTWHEKDKAPYGGYVTHQLMQSLFQQQHIPSRYAPFYELQEHDSLKGNLLVIANQIALDSADVQALENHLKKGNEALIVARNFSGELQDKFELETKPVLKARLRLNPEKSNKEKIVLQFKANGFPKTSYSLPQEVAFMRFHKTGVAHENLLMAQDSLPIAQRFKVGQGHLTLCLAPLLLTNYYMLDSAARPVAHGLLSFLPYDQPLSHIEYYQVGRLESQTPLRYILHHPALKMAYWVMLIGIILFMIFEGKRRQRIIPVIPPLQNSSKVFTETLGHLYYNTRGNHQNMAEKRIAYFLEYCRRHYRVQTHYLDKNLAEELARKSGKDERQIERLLKLITQIRTTGVSEGQFTALEKLLNEFYGITDAQNE